MQEIVIHLGLHKTGTTYLQRYVFPKLKDVEVQHLMQICQIKFKSDKKILLISSEGLLSSMAHYPDNNTVEDSIEGLYRMYPKAKIILGVRKWDKWFRSCWNQYVRGGGTLSYCDYINKFKNNHLKPREYIDLMEKRWKYNVFVYDHQELLMHPHEVIKRMCNFMGVPTPSYETISVNKSFSKDKIRLLNLFNKYTFGIYNKVYTKITCG